MQINSIGSNFNQNKNYKCSNNKSYTRNFAVKNFNPSFGSLNPLDWMATGFDALSRGGLAASFITQDVLACGLPRTISSANRNSEDLGHPNYIAAGETAIRESTTGSSMFIIPALVLLLSGKTLGTATKMPVCTIHDFQCIVSEMDLKNKKPEKIKEEFYRKVYERIAENGEIKKESVDDFVKLTVDAEKARKRGFIGNMWKKTDENNPYKEQLLDDLEAKFSSEKKHLSHEYTDFTSATIKKPNLENEAKNCANSSVDISKLLKHMDNYIQDYTKYFNKHIEESNPTDILKNFTNERIGGRFVANIGLTSLVFLFLTFIPRLYSISNTNPESVMKEGGNK